MTIPFMNIQLSTEDRLLNILEGTQAGTWEWGVQSGEVIFNNRWAEIIGYTIKELSPVSIETWRKLVHPDDLQKSNDLLLRHFDGELEYYECEVRMRHKDGHWVWVLDRGKVCSWTETGKPLWMFGTHVDISEQVLTREALASSEDRFKALSDASFGGVIVHDKGLILDCNQGLTDITGFSRDELIGMDGFKLIEPRSLDTVLSHVRNGYTERYEVEGVRKNGAVYPLSIRGKDVCYKGEKVRVIEFFDLTESKEAEKRFEDIATSLAGRIWEVDLAGRYIYVSENIQDALGYRVDEILGKKTFDFMTENQVEKSAAFFEKLLASPQAFFDHENWNYHKNGQLVCFSTSGVPIFSKDSELIGFRGVDKDITEVKKLIELKDEQARLFQSMFINHHAVMMLIEAETGKIVDVNKAAIEFYGYSKEIFKGMFIQQINQLSDEEVEKVRTKASHGEQTHFEFKHQLSSGEIRDVEVFVSNINQKEKSVLFSIVHDITERKKLMEEQSRSAQLAALGTVAAGVAHEINNPIQGILNFAELLKLKPEDICQVKEIADRIDYEGERIAKLTSNLLSYAKDSRQEIILSEVNELISSALSLVGSKIKHSKVKITTELAQDMPPVLLQPQSFQQIILNLIDNAYDALRYSQELSEEKNIKVKTSRGKRAGDDFLRVDVSDNGIGMSGDVLNKVHLAFFTTKPSSEGTGLGLSIVSDILKKHNGFMEIESEEGKGTNVSFYIPIKTTM